MVLSFVPFIDCRALGSLKTLIRAMLGLPIVVRVVQLQEVMCVICWYSFTAYGIIWYFVWLCAMSLGRFECLASIGV